MRVRSRAAPIPTFAAERAGRNRRWTTRTRAPIRANGFMYMVALAGVLSIRNALNVNRTGGASQALWDPLVEDASCRLAASATRCLLERVPGVARTDLGCRKSVLCGGHYSSYFRVAKTALECLSALGYSRIPKSIARPLLEVTIAHRLHPHSN